MLTRRSLFSYLAAIVVAPFAVKPAIAVAADALGVPAVPPAPTTPRLIFDSGAFDQVWSERERRERSENGRPVLEYCSSELAASPDYFAAISKESLDAAVKDLVDTIDREALRAYWRCSHEAPSRVDILYGHKAVRPDLMVRVVGDLT